MADIKIYGTLKNVTNLIFDKFNRDAKHNSDVIKQIRSNGGADTATCSNVLNVIKERSIRVNEVIKNIYNMLKPNGIAYFTVYEGSGAGDSGATKAGYQLNKKTAEYVEEIQEVFKSLFNVEVNYDQIEGIPQVIPTLLDCYFYPTTPLYNSDIYDNIVKAYIERG